MNYSTRPATSGDLALMWDLRVRAMRPYVEETWGWDEAFQRRRLEENFDSTQVTVLVVEGRDAGVVRVEETPEALFLVLIEVAPEYQGRGLGTHVIRDLQERARARGVPVTLQVLKVNPARRLYERLGFTLTGETETHFRMRWEP
jgi:ribosomal protein S18 acetylase RimI-like enzyme